MTYISEELKNAINKFIPYLEQPDFEGAIVSENYRTLQKSFGVIEKVIFMFKESGLVFETKYNSSLVTFESGARLRFARADAIVGLLLDAALIVDGLSTTTQSIMLVKSRLWNSKGAHNNLWLIDEGKI